MDPEIRARIQAEIDSKPVVLFMKGTRTAPQCGFSATVIQILDSLIEDYKTVNVLADAEIRQGIKDFSDWPTIPQLYVKGEFVGGCDIVKEMAESGQLEEALGVQVAEVEPPKVVVTAAAAAAFGGAVQGTEDFIHLEIDGSYNHSLTVGPRSSRDLTIAAGPITLLIDRGSAKRAAGVQIDFVDSPNGKAFKITNPNEPPKVRALDVKQLKAKLDGGAIELFDVRTPREREIAHIEGARLLDRAAQDRIMKLPKDTALFFHCHHGGRSQQAAEFFLNQGFKEVYNVEGGIDAWSREVDSDVPRYD
jgi:monothiol glutaredoxin